MARDSTFVLGDAKRSPEEYEAQREALVAAFAISDNDERADALIAVLARHLPEELLRETFDAARAISNGYDRAEALATLAPYLPKTLFPEALATAVEIPDEYFRAHALVKLIPYLPQTLYSDVITAARATREQCEYVLTELVGHLPEKLLPDAFAAACAISRDTSRAHALVSLAPYLPEELLRDALNAAQALSDGYDRAKALTALAPRLPKMLLAQALEAARAISNDNERARALAAINAITIAGSNPGINQEKAELISDNTGYTDPETLSPEAAGHPQLRMGETETIEEFAARKGMTRAQVEEAADAWKAAHSEIMAREPAVRAEDTPQPLVTPSAEADAPAQVITREMLLGSVPPSLQTDGRQKYAFSDELFDDPQVIKGEESIANKLKYKVRQKQPVTDEERARAQVARAFLSRRRRRQQPANG